VQAANLVFKGKPEAVTSDLSKDKDTGVDKTGSVILRYPGGCFATLTFSSETQPGTNFMYVRGTKGSIMIPDNFWCPDRLVLPSGETLECPLPDVKFAEKFNFMNSQGLTYEAQAVRENLLKGNIESKEMSHADSEAVSYICQEVLKQHGITYNFK